MIAHFLYTSILLPSPFSLLPSPQSPDGPSTSRRPPTLSSPRKCTFSLTLAAFLILRGLHRICHRICHERGVTLLFLADSIHLILHLIIHDSSFILHHRGHSVLLGIAVRCDSHRLIIHHSCLGAWIFSSLTLAPLWLSGR